MKTRSLVFSAGLAVLATLSSCTKDMSFRSYEEIQKETYANSFVEKFVGNCKYF